MPPGGNVCGCGYATPAVPRPQPVIRGAACRRTRPEEVPQVSKVATVEAIPVSYPEPNDYNALRHLCLVKITTDDGVVGWGESITQFPEANFAVKAIIEGKAERVVGKDPLDNIAIWHSLRDQMWWYGYNGGGEADGGAPDRHTAVGSQ